MYKNNTISKIIKTKIELIIPLLHFLLTFIMERSVFQFSHSNWDIYTAIAKNQYISTQSESILVYFVSKLFAGIFIILFWKLVFSIIKKRIDKSIFCIFSLIFIAGLFAGIFLYPSSFGLEIDNYANYAYAVRFLPTYWHSVYTGALYAGCMMFFPHPLSIFFIQWLSFVIMVAYIFNGIEKNYLKSNIKYFSLLLFVLPESYFIVFNPYRNNFYTILCLYYFSYLIFAKHNNTEMNIKNVLYFSLLSAFIMVFRSEGILIGLGGIFYMLLFVYKISLKRISIVVLSFFICFFTLSNIQNIGSKKYYGQDYMLINTTSVLYSILNDPNANFSYEGANQDLADIESIVPVQVLKELGQDGFRKYNWTAGRKAINQTLADDHTADKYMRAYYSIILHNIDDYIDIQINSFYNALGITADSTNHPTYFYEGPLTVDLQDFVIDDWQIGANDLNSSFFTSSWENNSLRILGYKAIVGVLSIWRELWTNSGINTILHASAIILDCIILIYQAVQLLTNKRIQFMKYIIFELMLLGGFASILLFMPAGRAAYLYPMLYCSYLTSFLYFIEHRTRKESL